MTVKEEIQKLIKDLTEEQDSLTKSFTKVKSINSKINNNELAAFILGEVEGKYNDDTLPDYRLIFGEPTFEFKNTINGAIDIRNIPMPEGKHFNGKSTNYRPILFTISEIEQVVNDNTDSETYKILFTPGQFELSQKYLGTMLDQNNGWQLTRVWWSHSPTSFPGILFRIRQKLIDILLDIENSFLEHDYKEKVFEENSHFDASFEVLQLIEKAKSQIILIDGYVDSTTLKLLSSKQAKVEIRVLTDPKAISQSFEVLVEKFNQQYSGLEIKTSKSFHDRFLIIDNIHFYQIGASLKDLGNKTFSFIKLKEAFMTNALINIFEKEWN